jgi:hypothetical protein
MSRTDDLPAIACDDHRTLDDQPIGKAFPSASYSRHGDAGDASAPAAHDPEPPAGSFAPVPDNPVPRDSGWAAPNAGIRLCHGHRRSPVRQ